MLTNRFVKFDVEKFKERWYNKYYAFFVKNLTNRWIWQQNFKQVVEGVE